MIRLTMVFILWIASTGHALEETRALAEAELHEAYVLAWNEADEHGRRLLGRAQHAWNEYREANCALLGDDCRALMAQERAAELRYYLTKSHDRTILRPHVRTGTTADER